MIPTSETREGLNDARTRHGNRRVSARQGREGEKGDFFSSLLGWEERAPTEDA